MISYQEHHQVIYDHKVKINKMIEMKINKIKVAINV